MPCAAVGAQQPAAPGALFVFDLCGAVGLREAVQAGVDNMTGGFGGGSLGLCSAVLWCVGMVLHCGVMRGCCLFAVWPALHSGRLTAAVEV